MTTPYHEEGRNPAPQMPDPRDIRELLAAMHDLEQHMSILASRKKCPKTLKEMCQKIRQWAQAWKDWGDHVFEDIKLYERAICDLERTV